MAVLKRRKEEGGEVKNGSRGIPETGILIKKVLVVPLISKLFEPVTLLPTCPHSYMAFFCRQNATLCKLSKPHQQKSMESSSKYSTLGNPD